MVQGPIGYVWWSYRTNGFGHPAKLWSPHGQYLALGTCDTERQDRYRALFDSQIAGGLLVDIRQSINQGLALGSENFRRQIEELGGRRQSLLQRGPKAAS